MSSITSEVRSGIHARSSLSYRPRRSSSLARMKLECEPGRAGCLAASGATGEDEDSRGLWRGGFVVALAESTLIGSEPLTQGRIEEHAAVLHRFGVERGFQRTLDGPLRESTARARHPLRVHEQLGALTHANALFTCCVLGVLVGELLLAVPPPFVRVLRRIEHGVTAHVVQQRGELRPVVTALVVVVDGDDFVLVLCGLEVVTGSVFVVDRHMTSFAGLDSVP
jgi:hypothetical protein